MRLFVSCLREEVRSAVRHLNLFFESCEDAGVSCSARSIICLALLFFFSSDCACLVRRLHCGFPHTG